jgi:GT2 family glycosyltransferase
MPVEKSLKSGETGRQRTDNHAAPQISVIVPSYNRCDSLKAVLEGLLEQTAPPEAFEVAVVLDGSTDRSQAMLVEMQLRMPNLRWFWQENRGQAAARNQGAGRARGPVLLFLDDDVVPAPDLVQINLEWHQTGERIAVLGEARLARSGRDSLYHVGVWAWWEDTYHRRAQAGRRAGYRDFCTGNVSLRKDDFWSVGGFDPAFRGYGGEDFELGYRLLQAGVRFIPERRAQAVHYHRTRVSGVLRATRQEAHGDALMGRKHPELRAGLRLGRMPKGRYLYLALLALRLPWLGDVLAAAGRLCLPWLERARMRRKWLELFNHLRGYSYWRGVREALGSLAVLQAFQREAPPLPVCSIDLTDGLPEELPQLWVEGPGLVELSFNGQRLGVVELESHLDGPLHERLAQDMLKKMDKRLALALDRALQDYRQ